MKPVLHDAPSEERTMPQTQRRGMAVADLFRLNLLSDAQISPDGTRVAFVRTRLDEEKDEYLSTIWIVPAEGGEPVQFTNGPKRDLMPRWSPDGRWLAFVSERERRAEEKGRRKKAKPQLYVIPVDGGEPKRLTSLRGGAGEPVWSPDSSRIAFSSRVEPDEPDEQDEEKSKPARVITSLKYKANGEGFVYDRRRHIFVVPVDASDAMPEAKQITDGDWDDGTPAWSSDGSRIAFSSARHEERDYDQVSDIWTVSAEGGEPRRLTPGRGPSNNPAWSPDGRLVAYTGNEYALDMGRNSRVYAVPAEGGEPRCLTESLDRTCAPFFGAVGPAWSPDSRYIYLGIEDQGTIPVYRVAADGSTGPEEALSGAARQITSLSVAENGTLAYTVTEAVSPPEVALRAPGGVERRLTDVNREIKEEVEFSMPERFRYERAGLTLDCWVMKPAGYEPGRRYPVLLNVHGGPATQYGFNFFDEFQVQAGAGYAVVYTNPRGSQGYGEEFTRAVRGDWGGNDYLDVMAGLDEALRRHDFLDPERLGVLGGSYGGFMTSWIVGHTDRFKAACSERAVNNTYTLFGTSDIGSHFSETQAGVQPWEGRQWYVDHSPLTYAPNITTPLLIMHAENDIRCPIEQAEELFVVLKKLRKEVLFVRFPDENHEMSRTGRPRHRRDRFGFILDWMSKFLQSEARIEREKEAAVAD
jgi:dipeptidyl aminopeptidase/acylaminoacyl peptidase